MSVIRGMVAKGGVALAAIALVLSPAAAQKPKKRIAANPASALGGFTPAANPRANALLSRNGLGGDIFSFTPAGQNGRRAVNVVVRARNIKPAVTRHAPTVNVASAAPAETAAALQPIAYNLGVGVGWKRFALAGEVARVDGGLIPGRRELADVGVSYSGKRWSTRLGLSADRSVGNDTIIDNQDSYAVDFGGSFSPAKNLELTGGLRYKVEREHLDIFDDRRDSQAVYVGTAFKF